MVEVLSGKDQQAMASQCRAQLWDQSRSCVSGGEIVATAVRLGLGSEGPRPDHSCRVGADSCGRRCCSARGSVWYPDSQSTWKASFRRPRSQRYAT